MTKTPKPAHAEGCLGSVRDIESRAMRGDIEMNNHDLFLTTDLPGINKVRNRRIYPITLRPELRRHIHIIIRKLLHYLL